MNKFGKLDVAVLLIFLATLIVYWVRGSTIIESVYLSAVYSVSAAVSLLCDVYRNKKEIRPTVCTIGLLILSSIIACTTFYKCFFLLR